MTVFLFCIVEIYDLLDQLVYLPATDKRIESLLSLLLLLLEERVILLDHLVIGQSRPHTRRAEGLRKKLNQIALVKLARQILALLQVLLLQLLGYGSLDYILEVEDGIDEVLVVVADVLDEREEVRVVEEEVLVLVEQVVYVHPVVAHRYVLDDELLMQELREDEEDEDAGEGEELHVAAEEELVIETEVRDVHRHIQYAHRQECLVLVQLVELQDLLQDIELSEEREVLVELVADNLNKLVEGRIAEDLEFLCQVLLRLQLLHLLLEPLLHLHLVHHLLAHFNTLFDHGVEVDELAGAAGLLELVDGNVTSLDELGEFVVAQAVQEVVHVGIEFLLLHDD